MYKVHIEIECEYNHYDAAVIRVKELIASPVLDVKYATITDSEGNVLVEDEA